MNLYNEFRPLAVELLGDFGVTATLTRVSAVNDTKRSKLGLEAPASSTTTTITTMAAKLDVVSQDDKGLRVTTATALVLDEPRENDKLTLAGKSYTVGKVTAIEPQGQGIYWQVVLS